MKKAWKGGVSFRVLGAVAVALWVSSGPGADGRVFGEAMTREEAGLENGF